MAIENTPQPASTIMHTSKEEEGPVRGEAWVVLRALGLLVGGMMLAGYLIA